MPAPQIYNPAIVWPTILDAIASGDSLSTALTRLSPAPSYSWAKLALRSDDLLKQAYDQATQDRGDRLAEELLDLADSPMPVGLDGPAMSAWVQQLRLRVDVRKWSAAKLRPKVYGDRIDVAVTHEQISITQALNDAHKRVLTIDAE